MSSIFNPQDQDNIDRKIAVGLDRIAQAMKTLVWQESKTSGLSPIQIQFLVLLFYADEEKISIGVLASHFALTPATVSDAVTALENKGLILRERKKEDRRTVFVSLSRKGRTSAKKLSGWANGLMERISKLGDDQKAIVLPALIQIINGFEGGGVVCQTKMCVTCQYFSQGLYEGPSRQHHCTRFNLPLGDADLRIDCPGHQP